MMNGNNPVLHLQTAHDATLKQKNFLSGPDTCKLQQ